MYCSNCGQKAAGNFCTHCGHKLQQDNLPTPVDSQEPLEPIFDVDPPAGDQWIHQVNYKALIRHPDVRELLVMAGNRAHASVTGEDFLKKFDSVVPGLSIATSIVQPLYSKWGINTGKTVSQRFEQPVGKVIVNILCALAEGSSKLRNVEQLPDGCRIEASIPSDIWSFEGVVYIHVARQGNGAVVEAATKIPGQLFDFGKSRRVLDHLLENVA